MNCLHSPKNSYLLFFSTWWSLAIFFFFFLCVVVLWTDSTAVCFCCLWAILLGQLFFNLFTTSKTIKPVRWKQLLRGAERTMKGIWFKKTMMTEDAFTFLNIVFSREARNLKRFPWVKSAEETIRIKLSVKFKYFKRKKVRTGCQSCTMLKFVKLWYQRVY